MSTFSLPSSETVINASVETMLWQAGEMFDRESYSLPDMWDEVYDVDSAHFTTLTQILTDVYGFIGRISEDDLDEYLSGNGWAQFIHDYWLTRNHHGAGFWDRGLGESGDRLTTLAQYDSEYSLWESTPENLNHEDGAVGWFYE